jgi:KDO2-lipid IV(A) lauroyltransferase
MIFPVPNRSAICYTDLVPISLRATSFSTLKRWSIGRFIVGLSRVARLVPPSASSRLGSALGDAFYFGSSRYRSVALSNLHWAFGREWTEEKIVSVARQAFRNIGKSAFEFLQMPALTEADIRGCTSYEGREYLDDALARGKGCLLITAHFGNWELMAARMTLDGYTLSVIARDADDAGANQVINSIREDRGYRVFSRDGSMKPVIQALRRNEFLGILIDQNNTKGIFVPFFGKLAATATGPAALARSTGAAVVPAFCIRQPDDTHRIRLQPALNLEFTENKEADLHRATAIITGAVEQAVRDHPDQWLWIHNRWKHRPPDEVQSSTFNVQSQAADTQL